MRSRACGVNGLPNEPIPKIISKRTWFVLFNIGTTIYAVLFGHLSWDATSIVSYVVGLSLINIIAWVSTRKFPDWKRNYGVR